MEILIRRKKTYGIASQDSSSEVHMVMLSRNFAKYLKQKERKKENGRGGDLGSS